MALLDVIKYEISGGDLVYKYPSDELKFGSQLIVGVSQVAFLVKGGSIIKELGTGTYTIKGDNFPLVGSVVNLPFGGESPFKCEVWFVSLLPKMDLKWGTISPIQFRDRKYDIIIPIRAYGQYGIKVSNPLAFFQSLVGNNASFTPEKYKPMKHLQKKPVFRQLPFHSLSDTLPVISEVVKRNNRKTLGSQISTCTYFSSIPNWK